MLPRSPGVVVFPALLLLMLAVLEEGFSADSTINIDFSGYRRRDASIHIPCVETVVISGVTLRDNPNLDPLLLVHMDKNVTLDVTNGCNENLPPLNLTTSHRREDVSLYFTITSDLQVACRDYIFNQSFEDGEGKSFTCDPVFPSNISSELTGETYTTVWRKFLYRDELIGFMKASEPNQTSDFDEYVLNKGRYQTTTSVRKGDEVTIDFNSARTNIELNVRDEGRHLIGFYAPSVEVQMQENFTLLAPFFAVYVSPDFTSYDDTNFSVVHGSDSAENYDKLRCRTTSFPPAVISWEFRQKGHSSYRLLDENNHTYFHDISDRYPKRFQFTVDGQLIIDDVEYDDAGTYRCTATNAASGETIDRSIILRVRNPLRPLWPALGILASFAITAAFIVGGYVYERVRGKSTRLEEHDTRNSDPGRHLSVSSAVQEEAENNSGGIWHRAMKRVSSAQQELLPSNQ